MRAGAKQGNSPPEGGASRKPQLLQLAEGRLQGQGAGRGK